MERVTIPDVKVLTGLVRGKEMGKELGTDHVLAEADGSVEVPGARWISTTLR